MTGLNSQFQVLVRKKLSTHVSAATLVHEVIETQAMDFFCQPEALPRDASPPPRNCAIIFNYSENTVEIYANIRAQRDVAVQKSNIRTHFPSSPIKIVLNLSSIIDHVIYAAPFLGAFKEKGSEDVDKFGVYVGFRYSPQVFRAPTEDDKHTAAKATLFDPEVLDNYGPDYTEWLETIAHHDWDTRVAKMSRQDGDQYKMERRIERALGSLCRQWGFLILVPNITVIVEHTKTSMLSCVKEFLKDQGLSVPEKDKRHVKAFRALRFGSKDNPSGREPDMLSSIKGSFMPSRLLAEYYQLLYEKRGNLCWGALVVVLSNGILPDVWFERWMFNKKAEEAGENRRFDRNSIPAQILDREKYEDGWIWHALTHLRHRCFQRNGAIEGSKIFRECLSLAQQMRANLPFTKSTHSQNFHIYITPTKTLVDGPYNELNNRMLRQFPNCQQYFVRATFVDHGRNEIFFNDLDSFLLSEKMRLTFHTGCMIGHRLYQFLSYGNSQLRTKSFWAIHAFSPEFTPEKVLNKFGDWAALKEPGKKAARQGQCFSCSTPAVKLDATEFQVNCRDLTTVAVQKEDAKDGRLREFCWTDGVGYMRSRTMVRVAASLRLPYVPSCIQFRFAGAKGVLSVYDKGFEKLNDALCVQIRKSQNKFQATDFKDIEVCDHARNIPFQFNKHMILLMDTLGVPAEAFTDVIRKETNLMRSIFDSRGNALRFLSLCLSLSDCIPMMMRFLRSGFHPQKDPFLKACLVHLRLWYWKEQLLEFRIPNANGATLFGIFDENRALKYCNGEGFPQVFIQVTPKAEAFNMGGQTLRNLFNEEDDPYVASIDQWGSLEVSPGVYERNAKVITGKVMVTRSPSLHPGDILICEAVDVPALRYLYDVIVFPGPPKQGEMVHPRHPGNPLNNKNHAEYRDIPNMLGGGDLDGDQFQCLWDPRFVQPLADLHEASDNCRNTPASFYIPGWDEQEATEQNSIRKGDTSEFFIRFQMGSNVGRIANQWLANAHDPEIYGSLARPGLKAASTTCLQLAALHSKAVDFAKTGIPAFIPSNLVVRAYPHFMPAASGRSKKYFHSESLLGGIYDTLNQVDPRTTWGAQVGSVVSLVECTLMGRYTARRRQDRWKGSKRGSHAMYYVNDRNLYDYRSPDVSSQTDKTRESINFTSMSPNHVTSAAVRLIWRLEWADPGSCDLTHIDSYTVEIQVSRCGSGDMSNRGVEFVSRTLAILEFSVRDRNKRELMDSELTGAMAWRANLVVEGQRHLLFFSHSPIYTENRWLKWPLEFKFVIRASQAFTSTVVAETPVLSLADVGLYTYYVKGPPDFIRLAFETLPRPFASLPTEAVAVPSAGEVPSRHFVTPYAGVDYPLQGALFQTYERLCQRYVQTCHLHEHPFLLLRGDMTKFLHPDLLHVSLREFLTELTSAHSELNLPDLDLLMRTVIEVGHGLDFFSFFNKESKFLRTRVPIHKHAERYGSDIDLFVHPNYLDSSEVFLMSRNWQCRLRKHLTTDDLALSCNAIRVLVTAARITRDDPVLLSRRFFTFPKAPEWCLPFDQEFVRLPEAIFCPKCHRNSVDAYLWLPAMESLRRKSGISALLTTCTGGPVFQFIDWIAQHKYIAAKSSSIATAIPSIPATHLVFGNEFRTLNPQFELYNPAVPKAEQHVKDFCNFVKKHKGFTFRRELLHRNFVTHLKFAIQLKDQYTMEAVNLMRSLNMMPESGESLLVTGCQIADGSSNYKKDRVERSKIALEQLRESILQKSILTDWRRDRVNALYAGCNFDGLEDGFVGPPSLTDFEDLLARASAAYVACALNLTFRKQVSPFVFFVRRGADPLDGFKRHLSDELSRPDDSFSWPCLESFPFFAFGPQLCSLMENFSKWFETETAVMRVKEGMFRRLDSLVKSDKIKAMMEDVDRQLLEAPRIDLNADAQKMAVTTLAGADVLNPVRSVTDVNSNNTMLWAPFLHEEFESIDEECRQGYAIDSDPEDDADLLVNMASVTVVADSLANKIIYESSRLPLSVSDCVTTQIS
eukprot:Gregarina_sp_Poly_1__7435@NODE_412_length_8758_cov_48_108733_g335_i0_p1_GENE_NODE_412_length_8758_cov_48_108733_g335_i0NODE_412_length_8758_cov_48_108733_g335_i0_p1_ORF_typecomplete_len2015_score241_88RdRP/PF05183_12/2_2e120_NODE_412_length_8758_cov_48_108733_g335_i02686312